MIASLSHLEVLCLNVTLMRSTIAYSKIKKRNLVLINNATYQRETLSKRPIRQPLKIQTVALRLYVAGENVQNCLRSEGQISNIALNSAKVTLR